MGLHGLPAYPARRMHGARRNRAARGITLLDRKTSSAIRWTIAFLTVSMLALGEASCTTSTHNAVTSAEGSKSSASASTTKTEPPRPPLEVAGWTPVGAPPNGGSAAVKWFQSTNGQLIAVAVPAGSQPFPVLVYYHGASGLFSVSMDWSQRLADAGYAVVLGCWNPGSPDTVQCPNVTDEAAATKAIFDFATNLPGSDPNRLAVMGVSSGAGAALNISDPRIDALVIDCGRTRDAIDVVAPILVLTSTLDPNSPSHQAWAHDLQAAGEDVTLKTLTTGGHAVTAQPDSVDEATADVIAFLNDQVN
jgi:dienelactone hydrolase